MRGEDAGLENALANVRVSSNREQVQYIISIGCFNFLLFDVYSVGGSAKLGRGPERRMTQK
jgi:hypothetical protein